VNQFLNQFLAAILVAIATTIVAAATATTIVTATTAATASAARTTIATALGTRFDRFAFAARRRIRCSLGRGILSSGSFRRGSFYWRSSFSGSLGSRGCRSAFGLGVVRLAGRIVLVGHR
jgi:hypothetical protein